MRRLLQHSGRPRPSGGGQRGAVRGSVPATQRHQANRAPSQSTDSSPGPVFANVPRASAGRPAYALTMSNLNDSLETTADGIRGARVGEHAGAEQLGATVYELEPGEEMVFHYHVQREELLIVLAGRLSLRSAVGWEELPEGEVVAFPRGERGAHGYKNEGDGVVRVLMISEMNAPNISVYPDTDRIGVFDAAHRGNRRFGALFNVSDAVADYGGKAQIVPPAAGPRQKRMRQ
jgi:uncharacterized cupin superfamily protein